MRFGSQTIIYGPRFDSIDALDRAFAFIADAGFAGVELFQEPQEFLRLGLDCQELTDKLKTRFPPRTARDVRSRPKGEEGVPWSQREAYLYTDTFPVDEVLRTLEAGYRVALHPHTFKPIHNVEDARRWFLDPRFQKYWKSKSRPQLLIIPDTAHAKIVWDDTVETCRRFRKELAAVHIKGWNDGYGRMSQRYSRGFRPINEDDADVRSVLEELKLDSYRNPWIVVEQDYSPDSAEEAIRHGAETLAQWGLPIAGKRLLQAEPRHWEEPGALASFEVLLRRRLEAISETDLDKIYVAGLSILIDVLRIERAVLCGVSEVSELDSVSSGDPVPTYTVLAVLPPVAELIDAPLSETHGASRERRGVP